MPHGFSLGLFSYFSNKPKTPTLGHEGIARDVTCKLKNNGIKKTYFNSNSLVNHSAKANGM